MGWSVFRLKWTGRIGLFCASLLSLQLLMVPLGSAAEASVSPNRYGLGMLVGRAYDPDSFGLAFVQGQLLVDYDRVFRHKVPDALHLKFEANLGLTTDGRNKRLASINMLALYYLGNRPRWHWTPYVEAGIGLIYTSFRVDGQGLYVNFNPQAGAGVEFPLPDNQAMTIALRLHHLSNGGLHKENRGVNSALLMIGYLF